MEEPRADLVERQQDASPAGQHRSDAGGTGAASYGWAGMGTRLLKEHSRDADGGQAELGAGERCLLHWCSAAAWAAASLPIAASNLRQLQMRAGRPTAS